jgi:hypothetical protein
MIRSTSGMVLCHKGYVGTESLLALFIELLAPHDVDDRGKSQLEKGSAFEQSIDAQVGAGHRLHCHLLSSDLDFGDEVPS